MVEEAGILEPTDGSIQATRIFEGKSHRLEITALSLVI